MPGAPTAREHNWGEFHRRWSRLRPPLRPDADVVAAITRQIAGHDQRVLLLGVTPELTGIGQDLTAVDRSQDMIDRVWPGDDAARRVMLADWRDMPPFQQPISAVIGDGSLIALHWPDEYGAVFAALNEAMSAGGRIALRCYLIPDTAETLDALADEALAGRVTAFHAFKWRLAMALCAHRGDPNIAVGDIAAGFDSLFPDPGALLRAAGWGEAEITEMDAYRRASLVYSFPTASQLFATLPEAMADRRLVPAGSYPLAERCPILAIDVAG